MTRLHQQPDGSIVVETDGGSYRADPVVFRREYGEDFPALPAGMTERLYEPGVVHALKRGSDVVDGGSLDWPEGDAILARASKLLSRQGARQYYDGLRPHLERQAEITATTDETKRKHEIEQAAIAAAADETKRKHEAREAAITAAAEEARRKFEAEQAKIEPIKP